MTSNAYKAMASNFSLILQSMTESLGSSTDPRLSLIIRSGSNAAMWAKLPAEQEKWDRQDLVLVRANADYSDTWLMEALSQLAGDLTQQGGKERLNEAEALVREGQAVGQVKLNNGNETTHDAVRSLVFQLSLQLAHILLAKEAWGDARTEITAILAFYNNEADDLGPLNGVLFLKDAYLMLLQIAKHCSLFAYSYDFAVETAKQAAAVLRLAIMQAPSVMPDMLSDLLDMAAGHIRVYRTEVDTDCTSARAAK